MEEEIKGLTKTTIFPDLENVALRLITDECDLFYARERDLPEHWNGSLPWWAFVWPGGYGTAAFLFRNRNHSIVSKIERGSCRVVDFACGCGVGATAALKVGATDVLAIDICPYATKVTEMNVEMNDLPVDRLSTLTENVIGTAVGDVVRPDDVVLCGDVLYDDAFARDLIPWVQYLASNGVTVIVGDPGRWVLNEMSDRRRGELLRFEAEIALSESLQKSNHGITAASLYSVLPRSDILHNYNH